MLVNHSIRLYAQQGRTTLNHKINNNQMDGPKLNLIPRKWVDPEIANENMSLIYEITVLFGLSYIGKTALTDLETNAFGKIYDTNRTDIHISLRRIRTHVNEIMRAEFSPPKKLTIKYEYLSKFPMSAIIFNVIAVVPTTSESFYEGLFIDGFRTLTPFGLNERRSGGTKRREISLLPPCTAQKTIRSSFDYNSPQPKIILDQNIQNLSPLVTTDVIEERQEYTNVKILSPKITVDVTEERQESSCVLEGNTTYVSFRTKIEAKQNLKSGQYLFACDVHQGGAKRYIVSDFETFYSRYLNLNSRYRMFYEVIGDDIPIKLYMDVEFKQTAFPSIRMDDLVWQIIEQVREETGLGQLEPLQLDASNAEKASRHLIFPLVLRNKSSMKGFVHSVITKLIEKKRLVTKKGTVCGIDAGVYDHDRCFRLYGSHKMGQHNRKLMVFPKPLHSDEIDKETFFKHLVSFVGLEYQQNLHQFDFPEFAAPVKRRRTCFSDNTTGGFDQGDKDIEHDLVVVRLREWMKEKYPVVKQQEARKMDVNTYSFSLLGMVCPIAGRAHQFNRIWLIVDTQTSFGQFRCSDPDCKGAMWGKLNLRTKITPVWEPKTDDEVKRQQDCADKMCGFDQGDKDIEDDMIVVRLRDWMKEKYPVVKQQEARRMDANTYNFSLLGMVCPIAGRAHQYNRIWLMVDTKTGLGKFKCSDPECKEAMWGRLNLATKITPIVEQKSEELVVV